MTETVDVEDRDRYWADLTIEDSWSIAGAKFAVKKGFTGAELRAVMEEIIAWVELYWPKDE